MTVYNNVFIDTAPFIYFIEKNENNPQYFNKVKKFFIESYDKNVHLATSVITVEEYMVFPYRNNMQGYIDLFERLIDTLDITVWKIDEATAKKAAKIRAEYRGFKAMDALQLATAYLHDCDVFLTNDKQLKQFNQIHCITVDELEG